MLSIQKPKSLELILKERKPIVNPSQKVKDEFSRLDLIAFWITEHVGTMGFFLIIFTWTILWLS